MKSKNIKMKKGQQIIGSNKPMQIGDVGLTLRGNPSPNLDDVREFNFKYLCKVRKGQFQVISEEII